MVWTDDYVDKHWMETIIPSSPKANVLPLKPQTEECPMLVALGTGSVFVCVESQPHLEVNYLSLFCKNTKYQYLSYFGLRIHCNCSTKIDK